jgi:hypothetical protein
MAAACLKQSFSSPFVFLPLISSGGGVRAMRGVYLAADVKAARNVGRAEAARVGGCEYAASFLMHAPAVSYPSSLPLPCLMIIYY